MHTLTRRAKILYGTGDYGFAMTDNKIAFLVAVFLPEVAVPSLFMAPAAAIVGQFEASFGLPPTMDPNAGRKAARLSLAPRDRRNAPIQAIPAGRRVFLAEPVVHPAGVGAADLASQERPG